MSAALDKPVGADLMSAGLLCRVVDHRSALDFQAVFRRIRRPLQWPMADFRRRKIATRRFVGFQFSRVKRTSAAGFVFGFALERDAVPGVQEPPEAVAYVLVRPVGSALYKELVARRGSPVLKLVARTRSLGFPFQFHPDAEAVAVRHRPMGWIPAELFALTGSDFFIIAQDPLRAGGFIDQMRRATTRPGL
jgi:hypothetical protein